VAAFDFRCPTVNFVVATVTAFTILDYLVATEWGVGLTETLSLAVFLLHNSVYHESHVPDAAWRELVVVVLVTTCCTGVHDVVTLGVAGRLGVGCTLVSTVMLQEVKVKVSSSG